MSSNYRRTKLENIMFGATILVRQSNLNRIQCLIANPVCRAQCDDLHAGFDLDLAEHTRVYRLGTWAQRERIFTLAIDRNAAQLLPWLANKLNSDAVLARRSMLIMMNNLQGLNRESYRTSRIVLQSSNRQSEVWPFESLAALVSVFSAPSTSDHTNRSVPVRLRMRYGA